MAAAANIFQSLVSPEAAGASPNRKPTDDQATGLFAALLATAQPQSKSAIAATGVEASQIAGQTAISQGEGTQIPVPGAQRDFIPVSSGKPSATHGATPSQSAPTPGQASGFPSGPGAEQLGQSLPTQTAAPTSSGETVVGAASLNGQSISKETASIASVPNADGADNPHAGKQDLAAGQPKADLGPQHSAAPSTFKANELAPVTSRLEGQSAQPSPIGENRGLLTQVEPGTPAVAKPAPQQVDEAQQTTGLERALSQIGERPGSRGLHIANEATKRNARAGRSEPLTPGATPRTHSTQANAKIPLNASNAAIVSTETRPTSEPSSAQTSLGDGIINAERTGEPVTPSPILKSGLPKTIGAPVSGDPLAQILNRADVGQIQTIPLDAAGPQHRAIAPGTLQPQSPQLPVNAIAVHIAQQAQAGTKRFDIRLDPPELGRLDIRLDVKRDGQATTHLIVERAETLDLLQRDARTLERALQNSGLDTSKDGLTFSLKGQNTADQGQKHGSDLANSTGSSESSDGDGAAEGGHPDDDVHVAHHNLVASDRVDIRI